VRLVAACGCSRHTLRPMRRQKLQQPATTEHEACINVAGNLSCDPLSAHTRASSAYRFGLICAKEANSEWIRIGKLSFPLSVNLSFLPVTLRS